MFKLFFPRWQQKNLRLNYLIWIVAFAVAIGVALAVQALFTVEQMGAIAMLVCFAVRFLLSFTFNRFMPDSFVGAERVGYETLALELNTAFERHAITFEQEAKTDALTFHFPEHKLGLFLQRRAKSAMDTNQMPTSEIVIRRLSASNKAFARELKTIIEQIADEKNSAEEELQKESVENNA